MVKSFKNRGKIVKASIRQFKDDFDRVFTFFVLVVSISNITLRIFGFRLIPQVKTAFEAFHEFFHDIMHLIVFSWLTYSLESLWYGFTFVCSILLPIIPWRPYITIPPLVADIALVSIAFTKVFRTTDLLIPRKDRAKAEDHMTDALWRQIDRVEGPFWGPIQRFLDRTNAKIWYLIDAIQRFLAKLFRVPRRYEKYIRYALIALAGAVFMWGYVRLAGYLINVYKARNLTSPIMIIRKRFLRQFGLSLLAAIVATLLFILCNGFVAEWLEP